MSEPDFRSAAHQLAAIIEWSDDAIVSKDLEGIITSWNNAAERLFGFSAEEALGRSIRLIVPDDRQSEEDEVLRRIRRGEVVDHFETWRRRKDGSLLPIALTVSPIRNDVGVIVGASKIARDVSERRRAELAVRNAEAGRQELQQRLQALVAASHTLLVSPRRDDVASATVRVARQLLPADACAVWRLHGETGVWRCVLRDGLSEAFAAGTGVAWGVPSSRTVVDVDIARLPPQDRDALLAEGIRSLLTVPLHVRGHTTGLLVFYYRDRRQFPDVDLQTADAIGTLASAAMTTAELYDEQRGGQRRSSFLAHVTSLMAAATNDRDVLSHVVDRAVPQIAEWCAAYLVDASGARERVAVAHGHTISEGTAFHPGVVVPGVAQVLRDSLPLLLADAASVHPDGLIGVRSYICVPLVARGRTFGALSFGCSEQGEPYSHADLLLAQDLASAAALAVDNVQAYDALRRADRIKDEFLATLSHELRTPLNAILGYARMLRSDQIPAERRSRAVEVLERNARALSRIVDDVLDVSRIISGKIRLNIQPTDLARVIAQGIETIQAAADAKGVRIVTDLKPLGSPVYADGDRLLQVCWNLLFNAVKFTPGGGTITVTLRSVDSEAVVVITDTGIGIPREFLGHIFERFRQADARFAREFGGLGLGLAISKHLVELHGGRIAVASDGPGRGASFSVNLPTGRSVRSAEVVTSG